MKSKPSELHGFKILEAPNVVKGHFAVDHNSGTIFVHPEEMEDFIRLMRAERWTRPTGPGGDNPYREEKK